MERLPPPSSECTFLPTNPMGDHSKDAVLGEECVVETIWTEHVIESG